MISPTDLVLWTRAASGDADAFGQLYERHDRAVQSYCLWRTGDPVLAEDLTSIVFLEAWRRRERTGLTTAGVRPLLLGIAINVIRSQWRSRRRYAAALDRLGRATEQRTGPENHDDEAVERLDAIARLADVRAALQALPQRERDVLGLVALADLTYEETAQIPALPVGTG